MKKTESLTHQWAGEVHPKAAQKWAAHATLSECICVHTDNFPTPPPALFDKAACKRMHPCRVESLAQLTAR